MLYEVITRIYAFFLLKNLDIGVWRIYADNEVSGSRVWAHDVSDHGLRYGSL